MVQDLVVRRGGRDVLRGVSFEARPGEVLAVVGPNGAGKSTLLKVISGYLRPAGGAVRVGGMDPGSLPPYERSRLVTYCGDEPDPAFAFTVEETVEMGRVSAGPRHPGDSPGLDLAAALKALELTGLRDRPITSLSSGELQRVYLARALYQDPSVFLLDEPTAHLDIAYEVHAAQMIRDLSGRGKTVITVVHDLNLALRCADRLLFLKGGELLFAVSPGELTPEVVAATYGVEVHVISHPALGTPLVTPPIGRKA